MGVVHSKVYSSSADPVDGTDWNADHVDSNGNAAPTWTVDASDNVVGLANPSGNTIKTTRPATIVLMGDSITGRNYDTDGSTYNRFDRSGYWTWAAELLEQRLLVINEAGVSGNSTAQILARFTDEVVTVAPGYCFLMAGINDVVSGVAVATTIANLESMYARGVGAGITMIAATILPSTQVNTDTERFKLHYVNNWIRNYCASMQGMILVDAYAAWADPSNGDPVSAMVSDGTHPTYQGAAAIGRAIYDVLGPVIPKMHAKQSVNYSFGSHTRNPMTYGDNAGGVNGWTLGTGITGQGPDNWVTARTGTSTAVASKSARSDWRQGSFLKLAVTTGSAQNRVQTYPTDILFQDWSSGGSATANRRIRPTTPNGRNYLITTGGTHAVGADPTGSWSTTLGATVTSGTATLLVIESLDPGDIVFGQCEFEASSFSGAAAIRLKVTCYSAAYGSTLYDSYGGFVDGALTLPTYVTPAGVLRTPEFTIPASTMIIRTLIEVFGDAGVTGDLLVTGMELRRQLTSHTFTQ